MNPPPHPPGTRGAVRGRLRAAAALLVASLLWAASARAADGASAADAGPPAAPLVVWNRAIAEFRTSWAGASPEERAAGAARRIAAAAARGGDPGVALRIAEIDGERRFQYYVGSELLFSLAAADLDESQRADPQPAAQAVAERIQEAIGARVRQSMPEVLFAGILWTAGCLAALIVLLWLLRRLDAAACRRIAAMRVGRAEAPGAIALPVAPLVRWAARTAVRIPLLAIGIAGAVAAVDIALARFPYTAPLANRLDSWLIDIALAALRAVLGAMPGLFMVLVIFLITRSILRGLAAFFDGVGSGSISVGWLHPESAKAVRRITAFLGWLFALIVAYPYIPGSNTDAFKGIGVFAGLLLSLGSAGMVNQVMSGLVVVFSRTMKPGDQIQVGEVQGQVTDMGVLATKVVTRTGHEVAIPNALLVGASVSNFSNFDPARGPVIAAAVTIGYDAPWRQVHAMLELAARRVAAVDPGKPIEVVQKALMDWYVSYELRCAIRRVDERQDAISQLHAAIQDVFNEHGVQIMSPNFVAQPAQPVLVPPGREAPPPARRDPPPSPDR